MFSMIFLFRFSFNNVFQCLIFGNDLYKLGDSEVAWVDSEVGKTESDKRCLQPMASAAAPHKPVLVGDLKMQDFKQFLASKGVQVEFAGGGALRCGEYVTLRKVGPTGQKVITLC